MNILKNLLVRIVVAWAKAHRLPVT